MIVLVYCILSLFYCMIFVFSPALCDIFPTSMAWYSLFVLKVPYKATNYISLSLWRYAFYWVSFLLIPMLCSEYLLFCSAFIWRANHSGPSGKWIWIVWKWHGIQDAACRGFLHLFFSQCMNVVDDIDTFTLVGTVSSCAKKEKSRVTWSSFTVFQKIPLLIFEIILCDIIWFEQDMASISWGNTRSVLTAIFPGEPGLAGCPLNSPSPFIPGLHILLGQA